MRSLYKHQKQAFAYSLRTKNPALFMDMRLGKTLVAIRRIKLHKIKNLKVLVAAPNSAIGSWQEELELEDESYIILRGQREQRLKKLLSNNDVSWFLINKEGFLSLPELASLPWDIVILDESTFIKNPKAKVTRYFVPNFRRVKHRWILTGLPNPENDLEFVSQMIFLNGEFCGYKDFWKFRAEMFEPSGYYEWVPKKGTKEIMQKELAEKTFIMSRKNAGMERTKIRENRYFDFPPRIRKIYDDLERDFEFDLESKNFSTIWATEKYILMRRLCGGWAGTEEMVWGGKQVELANLLEGELKRESVIIWFNFNLEIDSVASYFRDRHKRGFEYATIKGETKPEVREIYRKNFNQGKIRVLLIQQAVAQTGMNLSKADTAIYFSEPVGLFARKQTEDRILSLNKKGPLLYINLLVNDSVDIDNRLALESKNLKSSLSLSRILTKKFKERR